MRDRDNRLLVLDGQQRLRSLQHYYQGSIDDRIFRLVGVQKPFEGQSYQDLRAEDRRRLDDSIIHATILRDESTNESQDAVYSIYERLNTGGSPLQPQEIRIALYAGQFLRSIAQLNENNSWRTLYGPPSARFRDHELILRVFALYEWQEKYRKPLKTFLNSYLSDRRNTHLSSDSGMGKLFIDSVELINETIGKSAFRPERALNVAVADSLLVGLMHRLHQSPEYSSHELQAAYNAIVSDDAFVAATMVRTADEEYVNLRLNKATQEFMG